MDVLWRGLVFGVVAVVLACVGKASGQERTVETSALRQRTVDNHPTNRIKSLINSEVVLEEGQAAGQIVDFIFSDHGCIEYLVADHDDGFYVIPYSAARVDYQEHRVLLTVTRRQFRDVMLFKDSEWPDLTDTAIQRRLFRYWSVPSARVSSIFEIFERRTTNMPIRTIPSPSPGARSPVRRDPKPLAPGVEPRGISRPSLQGEPQPRRGQETEPRPKLPAAGEPPPKATSPMGRQSG